MFGRPDSRAEAEAEFERFAVASWTRLRWSAYLLCGDHHLAEDLAQTALVRTYGAWGRVRRDDALAYTRRALVNVNIDRLRRRRHLELVTDDAGSALPSTPDSAADDRDEIVRLLQGLSEQERKVVVLRHYYDLPESAVATELGLPKGTVKSTLSRALAKLRVTAQSHETPTPGRTR